MQNKTWLHKKDQLNKLDSKIYKYNEVDDGRKLQVQVTDYTIGVLDFDIILGTGYPLEQPKIAMHFKSDMTSLMDFGEPKVDFTISYGLDQNKGDNESSDRTFIQPLEFYLKHPWTPTITVDTMIKSIHLFLLKHIKPKEKSPINSVNNILSCLITHNYKISSLFLVIFFALFFRLLCGFGNYSGYNEPPKYGDFEAQRHWLELTYNTPSNEWYIETKNNNFTYWKIDYPPLTAYHSWLLGWFVNKFDPNSIALFTSRGYESLTHKMIMRWTVILSDVAIFFSAVLVFYIQYLKKYNHQTKLVILLLILMAPPLILIDHGHFQYNCCMLGLTLWAINFCAIDNIWLGSIFFTLAFNFKQMGLYYSIGFFAFILGKLYKLSGLQITNFNMNKPIYWMKFFFLIAQIGLVVILTMIVLWWPWMSSTTDILNVVRAIFPISRGLYQLKVATFWCITDPIIIWERWFIFDTLALMSLLLTLGFLLPSALVLVKFPNFKNFKIALFNISMAFFFFSYHVHEKTILIPLLPLLINIRFFRHFYLDFITFASLSCYQLFKDDKLLLQFFVLTIFYYIFGSRLMRYLNSYWDNNTIKGTSEEETTSRDRLRLLIKLYIKIYTLYVSKLLYFAFIAGVIFETMNSTKRLPYLYALLAYLQYTFVFGFSNLKFLTYAKKQLALENGIIKKKE